MVGDRIDVCAYSTSLSQLVQTVMIMSRRTCTMRPHMMPNQSPCLSVRQTNDISQEVRTGTLRNTRRVKKILGIVIIVSFRRSWKPHRPTDTQDESKEVRRRDADDVVGAKVNAGTDLLPSAASSHTYNRVRREGTQFCVTSNYGLFGIHKFGRNSIIHSSISQRKS